MMTLEERVELLERQVKMLELAVNKPKTYDPIPTFPVYPTPYINPNYMGFPYTIWCTGDSTSHKDGET